MACSLPSLLIRVFPSPCCVMSSSTSLPVLKAFLLWGHLIALFSFFSHVFREDSKSHTTCCSFQITQCSGEQVRHTDIGLHPRQWQQEETWRSSQRVSTLSSVSPKGLWQVVGRGRANGASFPSHLSSHPLFLLHIELISKRFLD